MYPDTLLFPNTVFFLKTPLCEGLGAVTYFVGVGRKGPKKFQGGRFSSVCRHFSRSF